MKRLLVILLLLIGSLSATTVTLNVTDTDGQNWANGTWSAVAVSTAGSTLSVGQASQSGTLNASGSASGIVLSDNTTIGPAGTGWLFIVCPQATSVCYSQRVTITGSSQTVSLVPPSVRIVPNGRTTAYSDAEVLTPGAGSNYFNLTDLSLHVYNGTTWGSAGGSASPNVVQVSSGANSIPASPLANTIYVLTDTSANYTRSTAVALGTGTLIWCQNPAVVVQFTGATDGFDMTGSNSGVVGCTLDHNSQVGAGTGPLINETGTNNYALSNRLQNTGSTNPTLATVYKTAGNNFRFIGNHFLGTQTDPCVYVNNTTASTLISDSIIEETTVDLFNPGANAFTCLNQHDAAGATQAFTARIRWIHNTVIGRGSNANLISSQIDIDVTGQSGSTGNEWIGNRGTAVTAAIQDIFHFFGGYHATYIGNVADYGGQGSQHWFSFGDTYNSVVEGNVSKAGGFSTKCFTFIDGQGNVIKGNRCDGIGNAGTGFEFANTANGPFSDNDIEGNSATFAGSNTGDAYLLTSGSASFTTAHNRFRGNYARGNGTTGQKAITLTSTAGAVDDTLIANMHGFSLGVGVTVNTGTTNTSIYQPKWSTITTKYTFAASTNPIVFDLEGMTVAQIPANLGNGSMLYLTDSSIANPCAAAGSGAILKRLNTVNVCN